MSKPIINGIDLSKYFKNHYDNWGRLYCVEYKGDPIELQNAIKRLQEESEELKNRLKTLDDEEFVYEVTEIEYNNFKKMNKYKQALEEIRKEITPVCTYCNNIDGFTTWDDCENVCEKGVIKYLKIIDEVLNEQK